MKPELDPSAEAPGGAQFNTTRWTLVMVSAQSQATADALMRLHPGLRVELKIIQTTGDRVLDRPLADAGGKGLFTKEIELALLAGEMKVSRVCAHVDVAPHERFLNENDVVLRCRVRGAPSSDRDSTNSKGEQDSLAAPAGSGNDVVLFEVDRRSGELARLIVRQSGGVEVEFRFENWHLDPPLPESLFKFEVPTGVAIVNGELPQGDQPVK